MRTVVLAILFVGGAIIACAIELAVLGDHESRPSTVSDREVLTTDHEIVVLAALEAQLEAAVGCATKAKVIDMHAGEIAALMTEITAMIAGTPAHDMAADRWMDHRYKSRFRTITARMRALVRECRDDASFAAAFTSLRQVWTEWAALD